MLDAANNDIPERLERHWNPNSAALPCLIAFGYFINLAVAIFWPNVISSIAATVIFILSALLLGVRFPLAMGLLAPFVIASLAVLISLNLVEAGGYMLEVNRTGFASFAAASYAGYSLLSLGSGVFTFNGLSRRFPGPGVREAAPALFVGSFVVVVSGAVAYLFLAGLHTGFPLLMGADRLLFRHNTAGILTVNILNLKALVGAGLGTCAAPAGSPRFRRACILIFLLYLSASVLYGDKFFILLSACAFFLMPFLVQNPRGAARMVLKGLPIGIIGVVVVSMLTLYIYSDHGALGGGATLDKFSERIAGQGQLWFLTIQDYSNFFNFDTKIVRDNLGSMFSTEPADYVFFHKLAPFFFVEHYYPPKMYASVLHGDGAVTPTIVLEAYGLVAFGYFGLAILISVSSMFTAVATTFLWRAIKTGNPVYTMLPAYLMIQVGYWLSQGTISAVISPPAIKAYLAFGLLHFVVAAMSRGMRRPA